MNFSNLENNIIDVIKEQQIKLGYRSETIRLYYPLSSLNSLLSTKFDTSRMLKVLTDFGKSAEDKLGTVEVSNKSERFCFIIPPKGADYVHAHMKNSEFIYDFIKTVEKHGCTLDDVLKQFHKHSNKVHIENMDNGEFDYLIYFEDGKPDSYRYCIKQEGHHIIYHRFTIDDYNSFDF